MKSCESKQQALQLKDQMSEKYRSFSVANKDIQLFNQQKKAGDPDKPQTPNPSFNELHQLRLSKLQQAKEIQRIKRKRASESKETIKRDESPKRQDRKRMTINNKRISMIFSNMLKL